MLRNVWREAAPGSSTQCEHPKKLDCKLRPPLESESLHRAVDAAVALQFFLCVFADLRKAYFEDIRSPADPGLRAHASSNPPQVNSAEKRLNQNYAITRDL